MGLRLSGNLWPLTEGSDMKPLFKPLTHIPCRKVSMSCHKLAAQAQPNFEKHWYPQTAPCYTRSVESFWMRRWSGGLKRATSSTGGGLVRGVIFSNPPQESAGILESAGMVKLSKSWESVRWDFLVTPGRSLKQCKSHFFPLSHKQHYCSFF